MEVSDVLRFQTERRLFSLSKKSLDELERYKNHCLRLEKLLDSVGFIDVELFKAEEIYKSARKVVLDEANSAARELNDLQGKFLIVFKKD